MHTSLRWIPKRDRSGWSSFSSASRQDSLALISVKSKAACPNEVDSCANKRA